jgi:hypothetical protein
MLLNAVGDDTGAPSMKVEVVVDNDVEGVNPRMMICWNERSARPELLLLVFMPGVLTARSATDVIPRLAMSSLETTDTATGVFSTLSDRLRAVT